MIHRCLNIDRQTPLLRQCRAKGVAGKVGGPWSVDLLQESARRQRLRRVALIEEKEMVVQSSRLPQTRPVGERRERRRQTPESTVEQCLAVGSVGVELFDKEGREGDEASIVLFALGFILQYQMFELDHLG